MLGAPESLVMEDEKLRAAAMEPETRAAPTEAERRERLAARRVGWTRSCLEADRKLRVTVDIVLSRKEEGNCVLQHRNCLFFRVCEGEL